MRKKKKIIIGASVASLLLFGIFAGGCKHRGCHFSKSPEEKIEYIVEHVSDELDMTEAQEVEVKKIAEEVHAKMQEHKGTKKEIYNTILAEVKSDNVDKEKMTSLFDKKMGEINEMKPFFIDKFAELHSILTPEQRVELAEKMEKMHKRMGH